MDPIRIVATPDEPYARDCFDTYPAYCKNPGFEIEYIYTLLNGLLQLQTTFVKVDSYEDVEAALDTGLADIAGTSLMLDEYYYSRWQYTPVYLWDGVAFIAKLNIEGNFQIFDLFKSFTMDLWLTIACTTAITMLINFYSHYQYSTKKHNVVSKVNHKLRTRGLSVLWFIFVSILLNFYSNLMIVELLNPLEVEAPPFDSVPQLGKKLLAKECRLAILEKYKDDTEFHHTFINPDSRYTDIWADDYRSAFKSNPPIYTQSREETVAFVQNGSCVIGVDFATMETYYHTRFCGIRFVSFPNKLQLFAYVFYFTHAELARNLSAVMASSPLLQYPLYLGRKYYISDKPPICKNLLATTISDSLPLKKFQGVFIVYFGVLFICAFICFSPWIFIYLSKSTEHTTLIKIENILANWHNHKKLRTNHRRGSIV